MKPLFPYPLVPIKDTRSNSIIYSFETDSQGRYELVFKSDSNYLPDNEFANYAYSFILTRVSDRQDGEDYRIRDTVIHGLRLALENNPDLIITYVAQKMGRKINGRDFFKDGFSSTGLRTKV